MAKGYTNTWLGGMNTDVDPIYLNLDLYMYAENIRVITKTGVAQSIEGTDTDVITLSAGEVIIGSTTIDNIAVIFTKVLVNGVYSYNKVYRVRFDQTKITELTVILLGDLKLGLGSTDGNEHTRLSVVGNYETDNNVKVYFTDGSGLTKVLNVVDNKYVGVGPSNPLLDSNGMILNPGALDTTPNALLSPFVITTLGVGNLPAGMVQYSYQLFNVRGSITATAPLSNLVHLTVSNTSQGSKLYQGTTQGLNSGKSCVLQAPVISGDFNRCRIIRLSYESNSQPAEITIVDEIDIIPGQQYINYRDTGNSILSEMTIEEFNALVGYQFIANTLEKLDNRLFYANVKEISWNPDFDARAYRSNAAGQVVLLSANTDLNLTFSDINTMNFASVPETHDAINPFNTLKSTQFTADNRYEYGGESYTTGGVTYRIKGGKGPNVSYRFEVMKARSSEFSNDKPLFSPSMDVASLTQSIGEIIYPEQGFGKYSNFPVSESRISNQADPYIDSKYRSYQRDEVYRFGLVLYNNKGIASPVKWIADIRMPHSSDSMYSAFKWADFVEVPSITIRRALQASLLGVEFTITNLPADVVAVEIVRCDRTQDDRTVLMLTAMNLVANYEFTNPDTGEVGGDVDTRPILFPTFQTSNVYGIGSFGGIGGDNPFYLYSYVPVGKIKNDYATMISPEISIMGEDSETMFSDNTYIDTLYGLSSIMSNPDENDPHPIHGTVIPRQINDSNGDIKPWENLWLGGIVTDPLAEPYRGMIVGAVEVNAYIAKLYIPFTGASSQTVGHNINISSVKYPQMIPWNATDNVAPYYTNVGEISFLNFPRMKFEAAGGDNVNKRGMGGPLLIAHIPGLIDEVGKFAGVLNEFNVSSATLYSTYEERVAGATVSTLIGNVKRDIIPYGGNTFSSRQNSIYISTNTWITKSNNMKLDCFGGDTYLGLLDYPWSRIFQLKDINAENAGKAFVGAYIPFESSINTWMLQGDMAHMTYNESSGYMDAYLQLEPTLISNWHVQDEPYFVYNPAYSSRPNAKLYVPVSIYTEDNVWNRNRIFGSEAKVNNEVTDSWTRVLPANYIDVDNQYGLITNLKAFNNRLFYFQDLALGIAAVNERSLIQDNNIGSLTLGTGGVLTRFDYVSNTNGDSTINDNSIVNSDNVIYWYDYDKRLICGFAGQGVNYLSKGNNVQMYVNRLIDNPNHWVERRNLNSFFDKKYDEVYFNFPILNGEDKKKTLIFNEQSGKFTGTYTLSTNVSLTFSDKTVLVGNGRYYYLNRGDYNGNLTAYTNKDALIRFAVNPEPNFIKVFDNVDFDAKFIDPSLPFGDDKTIFLSAQFFTKSQTSINTNNGNLDYREDDYRFPIKRSNAITDNSDLSLPARMRGKYLESHYKFNVQNNKRFEIPYISTSYRNSLL